MEAPFPDGFMKLIFDNGSKEYKLNAFRHTSPSLVVLPTVKLGQATSGNARKDHPMYGKGEKGSLQVMPGLVDSFTSCTASDTVPTRVAVKWARGMDNLLVLAWELEMYEGELRPLQGTVVPYCYGLYLGLVEGLEIGCLVLEWCAGRNPSGPYEINRQRMVVASRLHSVGIIHNGLFEHRHFVPGPDGKLRVVDFSRAKRHECLGALPRVITEDERPPKGCPELDLLEVTYGVASGAIPFIVINMPVTIPRQKASSCLIQ